MTSAIILKQCNETNSRFEGTVIHRFHPLLENFFVHKIKYGYLFYNFYLALLLVSKHILLEVVSKIVSKMGHGVPIRRAGLYSKDKF